MSVDLAAGVLSRLGHVVERIDCPVLTLMTPSRGIAEFEVPDTAHMRREDANFVLALTINGAEIGAGRPEKGWKR